MQKLKVMKTFIIGGLSSLLLLQGAYAAAVLPTVEYRFVKAWTPTTNQALLEELKKGNYTIPSEYIVEDITKFFQTYTTLNTDSLVFNQNFINKVSDYGVVLNNVTKSNGITYGTIKEGNCTILNSQVSAVAQAVKNDLIQLETTVNITDKYQNPASPVECSNALVFQHKINYSATLTPGKLTLKTPELNIGPLTNEAIRINDKSYLIYVPANVFKRDERKVNLGNTLSNNTTAVNNNTTAVNNNTTAVNNGATTLNTNASTTNTSPMEKQPATSVESAVPTEPTMKYLNYFIFISIK